VLRFGGIFRYIGHLIWLLSPTESLDLFSFVTYETPPEVYRVYQIVNKLHFEKKEVRQRGYIYIGGHIFKPCDSCRCLVFDKGCYPRC